MTKYLIALALLLITITPSLADSNPSETVRQFCQLDFDGVRLRSSTWSQVRPLISWEVEPGWDEVTGITEFHVGPETVTGNNATVQVRFVTPEVETITLHLRQENGTWMIVSPIYRPHVSQQVLCEKFGRCQGVKSSKDTSINMGAP